jgi:hypothetical protein
VNKALTFAFVTEVSALGIAVAEIEFAIKNTFTIKPDRYFNLLMMFPFSS